MDRTHPISRRPQRCTGEVGAQGFKPQYSSSIFEPFKRLHGLNVPGSGIGLATCKRTLERLGGTIWADSISADGSTFYFTLPALTGGDPPIR
jgi:signal transduction histidine kinase